MAMNTNINDDKITDKVIIVKGPNVTIYGECHNDIDNRFYEEYLEQNSTSTVWVEHSTVLDQLSPDDHHLFANAKGCDYIWFELKKKNQDSICIDNRLVNGFLTARQEKALSKMNSDQFIVLVYHVIVKAMMISDDFAPIKSEYDELMATLKLQINVFESVTESPLATYMIQGSTKTNTNVSVSKDTLLVNMRHNIADNVKKIASMSVDMNIIKMLSACSDCSKPIDIFVGLNHALRLAHILDYEITHLHPTMEKYLPGASMKPIGNIQIEKSILEQSTTQ